MAGLRKLLRDTFSELFIVDLGGEGRGALWEENIFDIQTPVAIGFGVKRNDYNPSCKVKYLRIKGDSDAKLKYLNTLSIEEIKTEVFGKIFEPLIPRSDSQYWSWPLIIDLFPWYWSGSQVKRTWPIGPTQGVLLERWKNLTTYVPRQRGKLLRETGNRTIRTSPRPLLSSGVPLRSVFHLDREDRPEGIEQYGYRSFDRQWAIADHRVMDTPRPILWRIRSDYQLYITTLNSTKFGNGPVCTVSPYVPDLDHFSGRGAKNVIPMYRDQAAQEPNLPANLLKSLSDRLNNLVTAESLVAYVYALTGTAAFSEQFATELAEMAEPVHIPLTSDLDLFKRAVRLGRTLLWRHTWGERFVPAVNSEVPQGSARELSPVEGYPNNFSYLPSEQLLEVGTGKFGPVRQDVWDFEVSGLRVVRSWLGYRMADRKGRKSSPLDDIRPHAWVFTDELLRLLAILEYTIKVTPIAADLLDEIVASPLVPPADLPQPTQAEREPPKLLY